MNYPLANAIAIVLFFMATACSLPWQNKSPKTESKLPAKSTEAPECKSFDTASQPSTELPVKAEVRNPESLLEEALEFFKRSQEFWGKGEFKNAVTALDQANLLVLQVDPKGDEGLARQKEKIRLMVYRRMLEMHATRQTNAVGSQNAIPLALNRYVKREINRFKGPEKKFFVEAHMRSGRYRPMIAAELEKAGLPKELSWLPLVESGFRVDAFSSCRALGLWQFIPSTGYKFGLKRDQWIDERMDAVKSTRAAIAYLRELHNIFGDWCTVLAAYNCGETRVLEVIRKQRVKYLDNFWDLFERLPGETGRFVPKFIATLIIINDPGKFGFDLAEPRPPLHHESVRISKQVPLKDVAKILAVSSESIEILNPELRLKITPAEPYDLKVPAGKGELLFSKVHEPSTSKPPQKPYDIHQVRSGETLTQLAGRYQTSVQAIADINHLAGKNLLRVGQKLKIPLGRTKVSKESEMSGEK